MSTAMTLTQSITWCLRGYISASGMTLVGGDPPGEILESTQIKITKGQSQGQASAPQSGGSGQVPLVRSAPDNIESGKLLEEETLGT